MGYYERTLTGRSERQSTYLQDPLLSLQNRYLSDRFVNVQRNIPVHAKLQNLGSRVMDESKLDKIKHLNNVYDAKISGTGCMSNKKQSKLP